MARTNVTLQDPYLQSMHPLEIDELNDAGIHLDPYQKKESTPEDDPFTRYLKIANWLEERVGKEWLAPLLNDLLDSMN